MIVWHAEVIWHMKEYLVNAVKNVWLLKCQTRDSYFLTE
jgi:hypothetical protein